jgi:AraC family transcriptional regulator of adaptative response/methylated-DNA-[protein]-cysteine methyltransferase
MNSTTQLASPETRHSVGVAIDPERAWEQLIRRDPAATFFYAVATTGVVCRPACKSRRPLRSNVRFFGSVQEAQAAGFRPCLRCRPAAPAEGGSVERIRAYIERHLDGPVRLSELGRLSGLSPFTVQRHFKNAMGVSPLQYQRALKAGRLRSALKGGESVTDAIYTAGFESPSRAYEGAQLGMSPARFAQGGKGEEIRWAVGPSPFGWVIVGETQKGLCWLSLGATPIEAEAGLREEFPEATLRPDPSLSRLVDAALACVRDGSDLAAGSRTLDLRGTVFQLRVWQALRQIPRGETRTYGQLARDLGDANATRAVARACATNRVALLVPCHRVVGAGGSLTGYRWGVDRKRQLLEAEQAG